ncbi:MAG: hypothetical protein K1Y36_23245 [Blastocatellia bacterium]|nr:hypothetical protein [Blastocatellia bacterium]
MFVTLNNYCEYEPIQARIESARVVVVDGLIHKVEDFSELAYREPFFNPAERVKEERTIAGFAIGNIVQNVKRLIRNAEIMVAPLPDLSHAMLAEFNPDAIVLSGTLSDFDLYQESIMTNMASVLTTTKYPVLGICGGHQLVGMSWGLPVVTLDGVPGLEKRENRIREYEYHLVKVIDPQDPIFNGIFSTTDPRRRSKGDTIWVWQNHGLMVEGIPAGFKLLAKGYLCRNQMMVKRSDGQLIYTVQFHIEKSFEDWRKTPSRWEHHNESRDGRMLFENFIIEALRHRGQEVALAKSA